MAFSHGPRFMAEYDFGAPSRLYGEDMFHSPHDMRVRTVHQEMELQRLRSELEYKKAKDSSKLKNVIAYFYNRNR